MVLEKIQNSLTISEKYKNVSTETKYLNTIVGKTTLDLEKLLECQWIKNPGCNIVSYKELQFPYVNVHRKKLIQMIIVTFFIQINSKETKMLGVDISPIVFYKSALFFKEANIIS